MILFLHTYFSSAQSLKFLETKLRREALVVQPKLLNLERLPSHDGHFEVSIPLSSALTSQRWQIFPTTS